MSPKIMMPALWVLAIYRVCLSVCLSVCTQVCYIYFISISVFILSVAIITYSPVCQSVCTFNANYVCTQPQVWSVHFSVSQRLLYKYILHTHDNRFCPSLCTFILSIFPSVRVLSSVSSHVYRIYLFVCPYICLERWNGQTNSVLAHIVLTVHQPVWSSRSCSSLSSEGLCFKSRTENRSPVAFFPENIFLLSDNFDVRTSIIIIIIIIIIIVVVAVTLVQCSPSVHFTLTHSKIFKNQSIFPNVLKEIYNCDLFRLGCRWVMSK
jgi:hypothetical protein